MTMGEQSDGRRRAAILALAWKDVDLAGRTIRWPAAHDKTGTEWCVPLSDELAAALKAYRQRMGAVGGWLFPAWKDPSRPVTCWPFDHLLAEAKREAKLPKLEGGLWHPYRRKWATERKGHGLKDVMAAGGWLDTSCLLACYQQADDESVRAVVNEPRKLRDRAAASG